MLIIYDKPLSILLALRDLPASEILYFWHSSILSDSFDKIDLSSLSICKNSITDTAPDRQSTFYIKLWWNLIRVEMSPIALIKFGSLLAPRLLDLQFRQSTVSFLKFHTKCEILDFHEGWKVAEIALINLIELLCFCQDYVIGGWLGVNSSPDWLMYQFT